jgi:adenosylcobinamide hydrolase
MNLPIDGIELSILPPALIITSQRPLLALSSALQGGGLLQTRQILNLHVDKDYNHPDPAQDLVEQGTRFGLEPGFIGLLTAVYVEKACLSTQQDENITVCAVVTAGLGNTSAAGLTLPFSYRAGTINTIVLVDANLSPAALVNMVMIVSEAKSDVLRRLDKRTAAGEIATGTSSDALVIAATGRGILLPYAGPVTQVGWLAAHAVRQALQDALQ